MKPPFFPCGMTIPFDLSLLYSPGKDHAPGGGVLGGDQGNFYLLKAPITPEDYYLWEEKPLEIEFFQTELGTEARFTLQHGSFPRYTIPLKIETSASASPSGLATAVYLLNERDQLIVRRISHELEIEHQVAHSSQNLNSHVVFPVSLARYTLPGTLTSLADTSPLDVLSTGSTFPLPPPPGEVSARACYVESLLAVGIFISAHELLGSEERITWAHFPFPLDIRPTAAIIPFFALTGQDGHGIHCPITNVLDTCGLIDGRDVSADFCRVIVLALCDDLGKILETRPVKISGDCLTWLRCELATQRKRYPTRQSLIDAIPAAWGTVSEENIESLYSSRWSKDQAIVSRPNNRNSRLQRIFFKFFMRIGRALSKREKIVTRIKTFF